MYKIFRDDEINNRIALDGYVIIPNFVNHESIIELINTYNTLKITNLNNTFSTYQSTDTIQRMEVNKCIRKAIHSSVKYYFNNYQPLTGIFISKPPENNNTKIDLHFDSNCVEETEGVESTVIWVSLYDVDVNSGGLRIFRGSHTFMSLVRPFEKKFCYSDYYDIFEKYFLTDINVSAGDAVIFLNRTLHMSGHNMSKKERISLRIDMIPQSSTPVQLYGGSHISQDEYIVYHIDNEYYTRFTRDVRPEDNIPHEIKIDLFKEMPPNELFKYISELGYNLIDYKKERNWSYVVNSFFNKLKQLIPF